MESGNTYDSVQIAKSFSANLENVGSAKKICSMFHTASAACLAPVTFNVPCENPTPTMLALKGWNAK